MPTRYIVHGTDRHNQSVQKVFEAETSQEAERIAGRTGVWSDGRKLASIGVAVRRWVSFHGFALNVCGAPEPFAAISPCGFDPSVVASMSELLGRELSVARVSPALLRSFREEFAR
jgi:lipoate-protein ligase B